MPLHDASVKILGLLRVRGLISAGDLLRELGVSRATLSRHFQNLPSPWVAIGRTRNLRYGLRRDPAGTCGEFPLYRVDEHGKIRPIGKLIILHGGYCFAEPGAQVFEGLPPELQDMAPQGFLGRAFSARFAAELNVPPRLQDWSDDHVVKIAVSRGEDFAGNLLVGEESARRWSGLSYEDVKPSSWENLVRLSFDEQPAGSSAGGEQPKFAVFSKGAHRLVKFAGPLNDAAGKRWRDLLYCEALAANVLDEGGIGAVRPRVTERLGMTYLEVERFDRIGTKGRRPFLTLAGADGFHFGDRDDWSSAAERMRRAGLLSEPDSRKVRLVDAFARLIGDTDRHFYNIGLFPHFDAPSSLTPARYELAPVYDKLPMLFAPVEGRVVERVYSLPLPGADLVDVWEDAQELAKTFWDRVGTSGDVSPGFKRIAKGCLKAFKD